MGFHVINGDLILKNFDYGMGPSFRVSDFIGLLFPTGARLIDPARKPWGPLRPPVGSYSLISPGFRRNEKLQLVTVRIVRMTNCGDSILPTSPLVEPMGI